jgi:hypothetical protein
MGYGRQTLPITTKTLFHQSVTTSKTAALTAASHSSSAPDQNLLRRHLLRLPSIADIWALGHVRLVTILSKAILNGFISSITDDQKKAVVEISQKLGPTVSFEDTLFQRTMFLIYFTAIAVLFDIYFGKLISAGTASLTHWILAHL